MFSRIFACERLENEVAMDASENFSSPINRVVVLAVGCVVAERPGLRTGEPGGGVDHLLGERLAIEHRRQLLAELAPAPEAPPPKVATSNAVSAAKDAWWVRK